MTISYEITPEVQEEAKRILFSVLEKYPPQVVQAILNRVETGKIAGNKFYDCWAFETEPCGCFYGSLFIETEKEFIEANKDSDGWIALSNVYDHARAVGIRVSLNEEQYDWELDALEQVVGNIYEGETPADNVYSKLLADWIKEFQHALVPGN